MRYLPGRIDPRSVELRTDLVREVDYVTSPVYPKGPGVKEGFSSQVENPKVVSNLGAVLAVVVANVAVSVQSGARAA
jgi:hypothetical protein